MSKLTTTLADLWQAGACHSGLQRFMAANPEVMHDTPITLEQILDSNGIQDALWCLKVWPQHDREWMLLACDYAESVSYLWNDPACAHAVTTARRYADGLCGKDELSAARAAAWDVASAAARDAEMDAANAAASDAAWAAANAANAEAWAASRYAALATANAASAAASAAASDAEWDAALDAALAVESAKQTEMLRGVIWEIENE